MSSRAPTEQSGLALNYSERPNEGVPSSEPHLILHKVRGEPAFDIAHRIEELGKPVLNEQGEFIRAGLEDVWIVSTSGRRAYPIQTWALDDLADVSDYPHVRPAEVEANLVSVPDHFEAKAAKPIAQTFDLVSLGLSKPKEPFVRRI